MAQVEGIKTTSLQAVAFHMFTKCGDQSETFQQCYQNSSKPASQCAEEYKALRECAANLVQEASTKAHHEFHHYTQCLDLTGGRYSYCRPEREAFEQAFPLE